MVVPMFSSLSSSIRPACASTIALLIACCRGAKELLEELTLLVGGDPDPRVSDFDCHVAVLREDTHVDVASVRRELHRVRDQVVQHLS